MCILVSFIQVAYGRHYSPEQQFVSFKIDKYKTRLKYCETHKKSNVSRFYNTLKHYIKRSLSFFISDRKIEYASTDQSYYSWPRRVKYNTNITGLR